MVRSGELQKRVSISVGLGLLILGGCTAVPSPRDADASSAAEQRPAAKQNSNGPLVDLNCVVDWIRNPKEAFHYSYSQLSQSHFIDQEADVTPQTIDGTVNSMSDGQTNPPEPVHAVRSNSDGWQSQVNHLSMGFGMPGSLMEGGLMSSEMVRQDAEKVNGYDATKYSVDTARLDPADRAILGTTSEKGTVWVTDEGCPVKIIMDTEAQARDGSVKKTHWEEAIVKK
ncbi:MAG TPA: hypothetical protein VGR93_04865 [Candidatus Acidoferrales bacterium]|nr:hypothetical protein [Candidatus Acidoferrales bacterium]